MNLVGNSITFYIVGLEMGMFSAYMSYNTQTYCDVNDAI